MSWTTAGGGSGAIEVRHVEGNGRGLFAARPLPRGFRIEVAPTLSFSAEQYDQHARHTVLCEYLFLCKSGNYLLPLGVGCLFNHSAKPNVDYRVDESAGEIAFLAARKISAGEELCIYYGSDLWFDDPESAAEDRLEQAELDAGDPFALALPFAEAEVVVPPSAPAPDDGRRREGCAGREPGTPLIALPKPASGRELQEN